MPRRRNTTLGIALFSFSMESESPFFHFGGKKKPPITFGFFLYFIFSFVYIFLLFSNPCFFVQVWMRISLPWVSLCRFIIFSLLSRVVVVNYASHLLALGAETQSSSVLQIEKVITSTSVKAHGTKIAENAKSSSSFCHRTMKFFHVRKKTTSDKPPSPNLAGRTHRSGNGTTESDPLERF